MRQAVNNVTPVVVDNNEHYFMNAATSVANPAAFELKGRMQTLTVLRLFQLDTPLLSSQLAEHLKQAPGLLNDVPLLLDCSALDVDGSDGKPADFTDDALTELVKALRAMGLAPIGITSKDPRLIKQARALGLALLPAEAARAKSADRPDSKPAAKAEPQAAAEAAAPKPAPEAAVEPQAAAQPAISKGAMTITRPVRSGQQIYAQGRDLVVMSSVSAGAEVIADGHVHIYGALTGRAVAGASGDESARVFAQDFRAELVAVAGNYKLIDQFPKSLLAQPAQAYLKGEQLCVEAL